MIQWRADGCGHEVGSREQTREMHFRGGNSSFAGALVKGSTGAELCSRPQTDCGEAWVFGLVVKAAEIEATTRERRWIGQEGGSILMERRGERPLRRGEV